MNKYYYEKLNAQEQHAYQEMYTNLMLCLPTIKFPKSEYHSCDFGKVFRYLNLDHPELYFVNFVHFCATQNLAEINVQFSYLFPKDEVNRISATISQKYKNILSQFNYQNASDYEKEKFIYDYLTQNVIYDVASLNFDINSLESLYAHSIVGVFMNGKAVCDGISKAFLFLARKVGLNAILVTGNACLPTSSGSHAWNIVKLEDGFYHIDVTGDLSSSSNSSVPLYRYLNINDAQMRRDHSWEISETPGCCSDQYNYYIASRLSCGSLKAVDETIRRLVSNGNENFAIRYNGSREDVNNVLSAIVASYRGKYRQYGVSELPGESIFVISLRQ